MHALFITESQCVALCIGSYLECLAVALLSELFSRKDEILFEFILLTVCFLTPAQAKPTRVLVFWLDH